MRRIPDWLLLILTFLANLLFGWICAFILYFKPFGEHLSFVLLWAPIPIAFLSFVFVLVRAQWLRQRPVAKTLMVLAGGYLLACLFAFMHIAYASGAISVAMQVARHYGIQR